MTTPYPPSGSRVEQWLPPVDDKQTEAQTSLLEAVANGDPAAILMGVYNLKLELLASEAETLKLLQGFYGQLEQAGEVLTSRCSSQTEKATIPLAKSERDFLNIAVTLEKKKDPTYQVPDYVQRALDDKELSKEDWKLLGQFVTDHRKSDKGMEVIPQEWLQQGLTSNFTTVNQRYDRLPDEVTQAIRGLIGSR